MTHVLVDVIAIIGTAVLVALGGALIAALGMLVYLMFRGP